MPLRVMQPAAEGQRVSIDHRERRYEWTQLMQGSVDWAAVMREIQAIGYDDYVITEVCGDRSVYEETCRVMDTILALRN